MMRTLLSALIATLVFAGEAAAEVDPINWCPAGVSIPVARATEPLSQAFSVVRTTLASETGFHPTGLLATLEMQPLPTRTLATARPNLGLRAGAELTPNWIIGPGQDILNTAQPVYCAITGPVVNRYNPAICLSDVDASTNIARTAFHARFGDPFPERPLLWGDATWNVRGLGRNQDWGTLGADGDAQPTFTSTLSIGAIQIMRSPAIEAWNRRAYNAISVQFVLRGHPVFSRALNEPIRIEGGDRLVITDLSNSGEITIQRMTAPEWQAFSRAKCDAAGPAR